SYDILIFFTYLYAPTVLGLRVAPARSILVPTAPDEPAIHLGIYEDVFTLPAGIAFNTAAERRFLTARFEIKAAAQEIVGCGVDLPQHTAYARDQRDAEGQRGADNGSAEGEAPQPRQRSPLSARGAVFRRRHRIHGPFALYGGRIEKGKGCEELIEYFKAYVDDGGEATLALMGVKLMPLPEDPFVNFAGLLSDRERAAALEAATVVVVPSPFESLSLLALEALPVGTPVLANARSEVLVEHCLQSNAGLYYANQDEFVECMKVLVADERLRAAMGRNGRDYVRRNYRWDVILGKYDRMMANIRGR
ncbi:MAG: glycosyltransferase family 1 protein, partial [Acidobacteria bacterium]